MESRVKENERFKQQLAHVNTLFERAREWADLSNCLQKVKKVIDSNPGYSVPNKKDLAKRLAQCLNPDLNVIHSLTLDVYSVIFRRELDLMKDINEDQKMWGDDLGLFYSGLFNFYTFAAFEVKKTFLNLIKDFVLKLKRELLLSLPGFMLCMLPALEDQNSELLKQVEQILADTEVIVGTSKFFGEIWKAMLRTPRCRLSAIKYLDRKIPREIQDNNRITLSPYNLVIKNGRMVLESVDKNSESEPEWYTKEKEILDQLKNTKEKAAFFYFYYPNKEHLVNNALLSGLSTIDQNVYVNRAVLDFLISHMSINGNVNSLEENIRIVEGALMTLIRKDFASLKKFFTWFQGHLEEDDQHPSKDDDAIRTVIPALKRIFRKFHHVKVEENSYKNEMSIANRDTTINTPIQILSNLLSDNMTIAEPILEDISVELIKYIKFFYTQETTNEVEAIRKLKRQVENLFQMISDELKCVWMALGSLLSEEIRTISSEYKEGAYQIEAIDLITFCLRDLKPNQNQDSAMDSSVAKENKGQMDSLCNMLIPIVSRLLAGVEKLSNSTENLEFALPALELIEEILILLDANRTEHYEENIENLKQSVQNFNDFYIKMSEKMTEQVSVTNPQLFHLRYATFKKSSQILYKIQRYSDSSSFSSMPDWLVNVIKTSCERKISSKILLVSIEVFLNIIEQKSPSDPNMKKLKELIMPRDEIQMFGHIGMAEDCPVDYTSPLHKSGQNDYCMDIIKTLWSLLDEPGDHEKIVQLLKKFDKLLPRIFSDVVTQELNSDDRDIKHRAVKKFAIFWKLTAQFEDYKPFQSISERRRFANESSDDSTQQIEEHQDKEERSYVALHNMLVILEDQDPTMRLSCRSWLSESKNSYHRILDPLLTELMDKKIMFVSFTGQLFFLDNYETKIVIENFGKLRNIILNTQDEFIRYIVTTQTSQDIEKQFNADFAPLKKGIKIKLKHSDKKYIQTIIFITLQFIMGQAVESLNEQFYQETQSVTASACEFMELMLKSVEPYQELSNEITHLIINPVIKTLKTAITNENNAQQVHLLNLLQVSLFEGNFYSPQLAKRTDPDSLKIKENAENIFTTELFLDCIIEGMKNEISFVRYHFIQFSERIMPYVQTNISLQAKFQAVHVKKLVLCFCDLLAIADVSQYQQQNQIGQAGEALQSFKSTLQRQQSTAALSGQRNILSHAVQAVSMSQGESGVPSTVAGGKVSQYIYGAFSGKKMKKMIINQENDIIQIIVGFKTILHHCLNIRIKQEEEQKTEEQNEEIKKLGKETYEKESGFSLFGFRFGQGTQTLQSTDEVQDEILKENVYMLILSVLNCWNDLSLYNARNYFFTRLGVFSYSTEDDKKMTSLINSKEKRAPVDLLDQLGLVPESRDSTMRRNTITAKKSVSTAATTINTNTATQADTSNSEDPAARQSEYINQNVNQIQSNLIQLLQPIAKEHPQSIIDGVMNCWLSTVKFQTINMQVSQGCEKLIQLLLSLQMDPDVVIDCVTTWVNKSEKYSPSRKSKVLKSKQQTMKDQEIHDYNATLPTLVCQFVYTYLLFNVTTYFKTHVSNTGAQAMTQQKKRATDQLSNHQMIYVKLYAKVLAFLKLWSANKQPVVVCWLLEILSIVAQKFKAEDPKQDKKLKAEYHEILDSLLRTSASILLDQSNTKPQEEAKGIQAICFSPTVYEMIKRYEFTRMKNPVNNLEEPGIGITQPSHQPSFGSASNLQSQIKNALSNLVGQSSSITMGSGGGIRKSTTNQGASQSRHVNSHLTFSRQEIEAFDQLPQQKDSIFHKFEVCQSYESQEEQYEIASFLRELNTYLHVSDRNIDKKPLNEYFKFFVATTLRQILVRLASSIYTAEQTDKQNLTLGIVVNAVLTILDDQLKKTGDSKKDDQHNFKEVQSEVLTEFMAGLANENQILQKSYKKEIMDMFYQDNFFGMSERTLRQWQQIMRNFMNVDNQVFDELLQKFNKAESFFATKKWEIQQKSLTFKRLAFLVYSSEINYIEESQLDTLLKKMTEGFKNDAKNREMRMQLFLLSRILMLRLSTQTLAEALRKLWPHLLNELVQVFDVPQGEQHDFYLSIEGIKLIELMSQLNIEDFQMNQWMFLFDGYGMDYERISSLQDDHHSQNITTTSDIRDESGFEKLSTNETNGQKEVFQPYLIKFMLSKNTVKIKKGEESYPHDDSYDRMQFAFYRVERQELESQITFSGPNPAKLRENAFSADQDIETKKERQLESFVFQYAHKLQEILSKANVDRTEIDRPKAETLIEKDFLKKPRF